MKIAIIGTGYVGLVAAACFSSLGHNVLCTDHDMSKLENLIKGKLPIFEPYLKEFIYRNQSAGRLRFVTSIADAINGADCCFITVGTPTIPNSGADVSQVVHVAKMIAKHMSSGLLIVVKSTVPVGTTGALTDIIKYELQQCGRGNNWCKVAVNPEFLREGQAINDFLHPDRIVIGAQDEVAFDILRQVYDLLIRQGIPLVETDINSAEMAKYAANVMLAARISLVNEFAVLCDYVGADVVEVTKIAGLDDRIGNKYLQAGIGYGGSCLPKDILEVIKMGKHNKLPMKMSSAIHESNQFHISYLVTIVCQRFGEDLTGVTLVVWGLSYKADTDDVRETPALVIARELMLRGAELTVYDPMATENFIKALGCFDGRLIIADNQHDACFEKDGLLLLTSWSDFVKADFKSISSIMRKNVIFDGRNSLNPISMLQYGFEYYCIGRGYTPDRKRMR